MPNTNSFPPKVAILNKSKYGKIKIKENQSIITCSNFIEFKYFISSKKVEYGVILLSEYSYRKFNLKKTGLINIKETILYKKFSLVADQSKEKIEEIFYFNISLSQVRFLLSDVQPNVRLIEVSNLNHLKQKVENRELFENKAILIPSKDFPKFLSSRRKYCIQKKIHALYLAKEKPNIKSNLEFKFTKDFVPLS